MYCNYQYMLFSLWERRINRSVLRSRKGFFTDCLTLEDGTDMLSRKVCNKLPTRQPNVSKEAVA